MYYLLLLLPDLGIDGVLLKVMHIERVTFLLLLIGQ